MSRDRIVSVRLTDREWRLLRAIAEKPSDALRQLIAKSLAPIPPQPGSNTFATGTRINIDVRSALYHGPAAA